MENEIWKSVRGYEGLYEVSNKGRVKSLGKGSSWKNEKILKQHCPKGKNQQYLSVTLYKEGTRKTIKVSRLVWETFNGPIPQGKQINHINEDTFDNRLDNLNLMTPKENSNWGTRTERIKKQTTNGKLSKKVVQYDLQGNPLKEYPSTMEVERELGFNNGFISSVCNGRFKSAYGFKWTYKR